MKNFKNLSCKFSKNIRDYYIIENRMEYKIIRTLTNIMKWGIGIALILANEFPLI